MKFKRQVRHEADINLTPMLDVVFLLLIFFMVSTTFTKESHLTIDLPEAQATAKTSEEDVLEILISSTGEYSINGKVLVNQQFNTLKRGLEKAMSTSSKRPTVITADAKAPHESVVKAMDAAGQLGLVNLRITTRQPEKGLMSNEK